jgi:hypothetical protein
MQSRARRRKRSEKEVKKMGSTKNNNTLGTSV